MQTVDYNARIYTLEYRGLQAVCTGTLINSKQGECHYLHYHLCLCAIQAGLVRPRLIYEFISK